MDRLSRRERTEETVLEEELGGAVRALLRPALACRGPVLVQAPHRRQRLVEGRAPSGRLLVAVPTSVRPLPADERPRELLDARVAGHPEPAAHRQRVALLRPAAASEPVDHLDPAPVTLAGQPVENRLRRRESALVACRNRELDQGDEPPVRALPLVVRVDAEPAVPLLAAEEFAHDRAGEELLRIGGHLLAEDVAPRQIANRRLTRFEQPVDGS